MFNCKNLIIHEIRNHFVKFVKIYNLQFNNLLNLLYVITIYILKLSFVNVCM